MLVSPLDWCLIELWKNSRIPLQVVLRGIDRSFEAAAKRRKRPPTTLFYCHPAVLEAFEEYQESMVGARDEDVEETPGELTTEDALVYLGDVERMLAKRDGEPFDRARVLISSLRFEVESRPGMSLEDVDRNLGQVGSILADSLVGLLAPARVKELRKKARQELKIYRKRLSEEAYRRLEAGYFQRCIREEFDVPDLSLFQISQRG